MDIKSKEVFIDKDCEWEKVAEGVSRKIMGYDVNVMMVKIKFEDNAIGYAHQHHHSQTSYVVSGKFELQMGDEKKIITGGDGFYVPPNKIHGVVCLEAGMLIDVFSPLREDFL